MGGVFGFLFSSVLYYYPFFNFFIIYNLIHHSYMIFLGLLILLRGEVKLNAKTIGIALVSLAFQLVPAAILNITIGSDYMFLRDAHDTPFQIMYDGVPYPLYVILLIAIYVFVIYTISYMLIVVQELYKKLRKQKPAALQSETADTGTAAGPPDSLKPEQTAIEPEAEREE
jgi:hypothetical protein